MIATYMFVYDIKLTSCCRRYCFGYGLRPPLPGAAEGGVAADVLREEPRQQIFKHRSWFVVVAVNDIVEFCGVIKNSNVFAELHL